MYNHINTNTYIYNGIPLSHKKEWTFSICSNMGGLGGHYAKWSKSYREKQILCITYRWNRKKYNKLGNKTKTSRHKYEGQTNDYQWWGWGGDKYQGRRWKKKSHMWNFWKLESTIEFIESFINKEKRKPMSSVLFVILLKDYTCAVKCVHLKCTA